jgi:hypothetical protein
MSRQIRVLGCAIAVAAVLGSAASAAAKTYQVAGRQIVTNEETGASIMRGGLIGTWTLTGFTEDADPATPLQGSGTEAFTGCVNRNRDRSCNGDPKGTLALSFDYWASFDGDALTWGSCYHPIASGTGAFEGAQGVLMFVDSPTPKGVRTRYIGTVTTAGGASARAAALPGGCG